MIDKVIILFSCLVFSVLSAHAAAGDTSSSNEEQKQLEMCYRYSNFLGYDIDTIQHPKLFETIGEWIGTRYCYGGVSKSGIDCSGFVNALYKTVFDIELEGSAVDIFKKSHPVKKTELHEGDLVFFRIRKKRISHVGVYLGQNKFAHASLKLGVTIDDLNEPYYKKYYYRSGRIDASFSTDNSSHSKPAHH